MKTPESFPLKSLVFRNVAAVASVIMSTLTAAATMAFATTYLAVTSRHLPDEAFFGSSVGLLTFVAGGFLVVKTLDRFTKEAEEAAVDDR